MRQEAVLIADDEPVVRELMRAVLEPLGLPLLEAASGSEALDLCWQERPAVVLLDVGMPDLNGIDACQAMKTDPNPPYVLLITGNAGDPSITSSGADGIVAKPFDARDLLARVRAALSCGALVA